ncbi:MAG: DUF11 domain-containing protein [Desulfurococcales archaeon]|nr:DUF11 domain-containing protein [Desulfurococcales archaeon]
MEQGERKLASILLIVLVLASLAPAGAGIIAKAQPSVTIQLSYVNATGQYPATVADGWDTLNFTLNITNEGADPAYDVNVNNTINALDPALWAVNLTNVVAYNTSSATTLTNGTDILIVPYPNPSQPLWLNITLLKPIPPGASILVNYTINVSEYVITGSTYYNEANLTSYSATSGGANLVTTPTWSNVTVAVPPPIADFKVVDSSSIDMTGLVLSGVPEPLVVTIGEIVTYEVNITVPEGMTMNMTVRDYLPLVSGVLAAEYLGSSSITVNASQVTSSNVSLTPGVWTSITGTRTGVNLLYFGLGNVTNLNNSPEAEQISIRLDVVVLDNPVNVAGTNLYNTVGILYTNASNLHDTSPWAVSPAVVVHEPDLSIEKTANTTVITNTGPTASIHVNVTNNPSLFSSPAYDVVIEDIVPGNLTVLSASVIHSGAVNVALTVSGNNVTVTADRLDPGGYINVTITVSAFEETYVNATFNNTATVNASSIPGPDPGERNYTASDWEAITYIAGFSMAKQVDDLVPDLYPPGTSIIAPPGAIVQYTIAIQVPLGTIPVLNLTDYLDPQTTLDPFSITLIPLGVTWTTTTVSYGPSFITMELRNVSASSTTGMLYILYNAQVSNTTVMGDVLLNDAQVTSTDGTLTNYSAADSTTILIGEPDLRKSDKYFSPSIFYDTYPYTVLYLYISNNGTLPAYDIVVEDIVPQTLLVLNATIQSQSGAVNPVVTQIGNNVTLTIDQLDPLGYVLVEVWVRAYALTPWNSTTVNNATINWSSLPGQVDGEKNYNHEITGSVYYDPIVDGLKTMSPESVTVGSVVEAVINVTIPTGNTSSLVLIDQWDNGMSLVGGPAITYPPNITVVGPITTTTSGNTITIDFGAVSNNDTVPLNITVKLYLRIDYVPDYPNGTLDLIYTNNATIQWMDDGYLVTRTLDLHSFVYIPPLVGGDAQLAAKPSPIGLLTVALGLGLASLGVYVRRHRTAR